MTERIIPLDECQKGHVYRVFSRNLLTAVFDGSRGFIGIRGKFGDEYLFTEYHWEADPHVGTVRPVEDLGPLPHSISPIEFFGPFCEDHNLESTWDREVRAVRHVTGSLCGGSWYRIPNQALFDHLAPLDAREVTRRYGHITTQQEEKE